MKIPFPSAAPVASAALPTPYQQTDTRDAYGGAMADAFGKAQDAAQTIEKQVADERAKAAEEAKRAKAEAYAIAHANADSAYQRAETKALVGGDNRERLIDNAFNGGESDNLTPNDVKQDPGFLETRGLDASAMSGRTIDELEKARQEIAAKTFTDPVEREKWLARNGAAFEDSRRKIEVHVDQQHNVAAEDALKGKLSTSLQAIANDTADLQTTSRLVAEGEQSIRALQKTKEGGDAAVQNWRSDVAVTRIKSMLQVGDVEHAAKAFEIGKAGIVDSDRVQALIEQAQAAKKRDAKVAENETDATQIVKNATPAGGYVDENKALAQVEALPAAVRGDVRTQVLHQLTVQAQVKKNDIEDWKTTAQSAFNKGGLAAVKGDLFERLNRYDPAFIEKLQNEQEMRWRRAKADARESHAGDAAERRAQAEANRIARNDYLALPIEERSKVNVETEFLGSGVNPLGISELKALQQRDKQTIQNGQSQGEGDFVRDALAAGDKRVTGKSNLATYKAEATLAYQALYDKLKRKPTTGEATEEISKLLNKSDTEPGFFYGTNEEYDFQRRARERKAGTGSNPTIRPKPAATATPVKPKGFDFGEGLDLTGGYKPTQGERARALAKQGKSNKEIADILNAEYY